jgi:hypothetical protein
MPKKKGAVVSGVFCRGDFGRILQDGITPYNFAAPLNEYGVRKEGAEKGSGVRD